MRLWLPLLRVIMLDGIFIINTSGKARLSKFYSRKDADGKDLNEHAQQQIVTGKSVGSV